MVVNHQWLLTIVSTATQIFFDKVGQGQPAAQNVLSNQVCHVSTLKWQIFLLGLFKLYLIAMSSNKLNGVPMQRYTIHCV